jgi:hypothetical protein
MSYSLHIGMHGCIILRLPCLVNQETSATLYQPLISSLVAQGFEIVMKVSLIETPAATGKGEHNIGDEGPSSYQ